MLDAWCGHVLGQASLTVLTVDGTGSTGAAASVTVGLDRLGIAAIDVVAGAANAAISMVFRPFGWAPWSGRSVPVAWAPAFTEV